MMPFSAISPPPNRLPEEYKYREMSQSRSSASSFIEGIFRRDKFLGENRCVICGVGGDNIVQSCCIIAQGDTQTWLDLKRCNWLPSQAKDSPEHEPRNCVLMCPNHRILFEEGDFVIRYVHEARRFIFINSSGRSYHLPFHGKAIALAIDDHYAPFPAVFIVHETRVRQNSPFVPEIQVPDGCPWQDWILADGIFNNDSQTFRHESPPGDADRLSSVQFPTTFQTLTPGTVNEILEDSRRMPTWKACQVAGMSWTGTAEENIQQYISSLHISRDDQEIG